MDTVLTTASEDMQMTRSTNMRCNDPMEKAIRVALTDAGHIFLEGDHNKPALDFFVSGPGVYIEVKQFHSARIAEQMSRVENVIVAQGRGAVFWLAELIRDAAARQRGEAQNKGDQ